LRGRGGWGVKRINSFVIVGESIRFLHEHQEIEKFLGVEMTPARHLDSRLLDVQKRFGQR
jgi:hypothetical protein